MKTNDDDAGLGCFVAIVASLMIAPVAVWRGYVLSIMWAWFMVPAFGLPPLGVVAAIGVAMTVGMITHQYIKSNDDDNEIVRDIVNALLADVFGPLYILGAGWVVQGFMP
jgi:ABC-type phosphate/phosphonate transport system permease subunit